MKKLLEIFFCILLLLYIPIMEVKADTLSDDIVILYTNDVHSYVDGPLSYDVIAEIKKELEKKYKYVLLVDAGDHVQGTAYGSMDNGKTIIELMNHSGYDLATLGNHEFDYGMFGCMKIIDWAQFPYISCNFYHEEEGVRSNNVLNSYQIFECGNEKIAFVGITTPETFTKSTPSYFQDEKGNYIYGISGSEDGTALYEDVQIAINEAKKEGASKIIALGHLGDDAASGNWTSEKTIANVSGLSAFIDGHSHSMVKEKSIMDKEGNTVLLTQTGQYFSRIGIMVIDAENKSMETDFIETQEILDEDGETILGYKIISKLYEGTEIIANNEVREIKDKWIKKINEELGQVIGFTEVILDNYDNEGSRLVRSRETNTGDLCADALYYLFDNMGIDVDAAIVNGGGVRNQAIKGKISYKNCKEIHAFGNVACLQTVTGQQILDALEWGARSVEEAECGGFLQVSGLTYKIDVLTKDSTQKDEKEVWIGPPLQEYRVHDVKIYNKEANKWEELSLTEKYNLAGYNYTLRNLGDGFNMFESAVNVLDYVMEDYMVLANYIQAFEDGIVKASNSPLASKYTGFAVDYSNVYGSGRIAIVEGKEIQKEGILPFVLTILMIILITSIIISKTKQKKK